jgi:glycosyltransferase involved in cell wall biosynthesis
MPDTTPLVSIITPAFNVGKTLAKGIDSILAQTYTNWELIIVDDGSTDDTWDVAQAYCRASSKITCYRQSHSGIGSARNLALSQARGEYIALADADDECLPQRLDVEVEYLLRNPEVTVVGSGVIEIDAASNAILGVSRLASTHAELMRTIFYRTPFFAPTVMARREFFDSLGGFDPLKKRLEDYDLWLRAVAGKRNRAFSPQLKRTQDFDLWIRGKDIFTYANIPCPLVRYRRRLQPRFPNSWLTAKLVFRHCLAERGPLPALWFGARPMVAYAVDRIFYLVCSRTMWLRRIERE